MLGSGTQAPAQRFGRLETALRRGQVCLYGIEDPDGVAGDRRGSKPPEQGAALGPQLPLPHRDSAIDWMCHPPQNHMLKPNPQGHGIRRWRSLGGDTSPAH